MIKLVGPEKFNRKAMEANSNNNSTDKRNIQKTKGIHRPTLSMWVENTELDKFTGCLLLKPGPVPSLLHFAMFHQSPSLISLNDYHCNTIDITYNYCSGDDTE